MSRSQPLLISLAVLGALGALGTVAPSVAWAASSASSASSEGSSASVGSVSTSFEKSSNSSSKDDKVAAGDYRVVQMAAAEQRPGHVRLTLRAVNGTDEFTLLLPQQAADNGRLAQGAVVTARPREYGVEFAAAATREAFFLVVRDDVYPELRTRAVTL